MQTLAQIDKQIRLLTGEHPESRPFICSGSPLGCDIAEVGINPGTPTPFWPHWSTAQGFSKEAWLKDYLSRHGKFGPTRRNIDLFAQSLHPMRSVELNIYDRFSPRLGDLPASLRKTEVFDYLLGALRPKLVLVHGDDPAEYLGRLLGVSPEKDAFVPVEYQGVRLELFQATRHFMKVSKEYVREVASIFYRRAHVADS